MSVDAEKVGELIGAVRAKIQRLRELRPLTDEPLPVETVCAVLEVASKLAAEIESNASEALRLLAQDVPDVRSDKAFLVAVSGLLATGSLPPSAWMAGGAG